MKGPPAAGGMPGPPGAMNFGKLEIICEKGVSIKAPSGLSKANPYCKLTVGSQSFSTKVHNKGGKDPTWGDQFSFQVSNEKELIVEVFDKDNMGKDKSMGENKVSIMDWIAKGQFNGTVDIMDKGRKPCGGVKLSVKFQKPGMGGPGGMSKGPPGPPGMMGAPGIPPGQPGTSEAPRDPSGKFSDKEIVEAFKSFDLDHNHFVGAAEIRHILINIGEQVTDEEVDEMIRMIDKDGDGQCSFEEFYEMVTGGKQAPQALISEVTGRTGIPTSHTGDAKGRPGAPGGAAASAVQQRNARKNALDEFAHENAIKPESIKKAYKRFQATDKDKSGMIDYTEFCEIMQIDPAPQVEKLFQMFDKERSGQIDVREFMIGLSNFTGAGKDDKLKFAFMVFDEDGNGVITKQELVKILKANHMATNESEVARKAETIMSQADKDGDGVVSFDEFVVVSKKFPNILFVRATLAAVAAAAPFSFSLCRPLLHEHSFSPLRPPPLLAATACVPHGPRSLSRQRATCACSVVARCGKRWRRNSGRRRTVMRSSATRGDATATTL